MGVAPKGKDGQKTPPKSSSTVVLLTIADTTWRMFVPSVGMTFAGLWLDAKLHTTPWLLFAGSILGLIVAALAVRIQYKRLIKL